MKTGRFLTTFVMVFAFFSTVSAKIGGQVVNTESSPLPGADVSLISMPDSVLIDAVLTDSEGKFQFPDQGKENKIVSVSMPGYLTESLPAEDNMTICMKPASTELMEVVVEGDRGTLRTEAGKFVYVPGGMALKTGNAFEALKFTPLLKVADESVKISTLDGNALIYINGKIPKVPQSSLLTMLRALPPENIVKIEVITNPGAKTESRGGIVNIQIVNPNDGVWGNVVSSFIYDSRRVSPSIRSYIGAQKGKMHFSVTPYYTGSNTYSSMRDYYDYYVSSTSIINRAESSSYGQSFGGNINASYDLTPKSIIGITASLSGSEGHSHNNVATSTYSPAGEEQSYYNSGTVTPLRYPRVLVNAYYTFTVDGRGSSIDASLFYGNMKSYSEKRQDFSGIKDTEKDDFAGRMIGGEVKFNKNFPFSANLNTGIETTHARTRSITDSYLDYNNFAMHRSVWNLYADYSHNFDFGMSVSAGLRASWTRDKSELRREGDYFHNNYFNLLPSASISYTLPGGRHSISLDYRRNFARPWFSSMNPYLVWNSENTGIKGNPYLKPSHSDDFSLRYRLGSSFIFSASYFRNKGYTQILENEENQTITTFVNGGIMDILMLNPTYSRDITGWWNIDASVYATYRHGKTQDYSLASYNGWDYSASLTNRFMIPVWNIFATLEYEWVSSSKSAMRKYNAVHDISVSLAKQFPCGMAVNLYLSNLLQQKRGDNYTFFMSPLYSYRHDTPLKFLSSVYLTVSYSFGNRNARGADSRSIKSVL